MTKPTPPPPPISIPLPLPVHFGLLPTRIPGQTLAPVLYSLINDIPIYITLSPSHQPHLSLLPLLLSLKPPIPPLHILTALRLTPRDYSIDLNGAAPYPDFWVPWPVARRICDRLGVSKLFWDDNDAHRGLISEAVKDAVSWDEGGTLGHNWLPPTGQLPASSYSLAALLGTPFVGVAVIPGDRCTFTPIDPGRRASIIASAEDRDHSRIRKGKWCDSWEGMLCWTFLAWEDYLRYPSKPPKQRRHPSQRVDLPSIVHHLLHTFTRSEATQPSLTPALNDLRSLFEFPDDGGPRISVSGIYHTARTALAPYVPFLRPIPAGASPEHVRQLQLRARVDLGIIESLSLMFIETWNTERERRRLEKLLPGQNVPAPIIIDCRLLDSEAEQAEARRAAERRQRMERKTSSLSKVQEWKRQDSMEEMRRARGGSPVSTPDTVTPLEPTAQRRPPTPPSSGPSSRDGVPRTTSAEPAFEGIRRRVSRRSRDDEIGVTDRGRSRSLESTEELDDRIVAQKGLGGDDLYPMRDLMLLSEQKEGWWMYFAIMGATVVAIAFGMGYGTLTLAERSVVVDGRAVHVNWRGLL